MAAAYRNLFNETSLKLEKEASKAIEANMLKGIGAAGNAVGKVIGKIPYVEKGPVDELLEKGGEKLRLNADSMKNEAVREFASLHNPRVGVFVEKMDDMISIFNHTNRIALDKDYLYLSE